MHTRTFRITTAESERPLVEALLAAQGFSCEPEPYLAAARRLTAEPFPLGSSLAAAFGLIYIQDRSSMLPPAMLAPAIATDDPVCLDMCASPGGKTGILAGLAGSGGFVLAVEASRDRLATLRQNLRRTGALNVATTQAESQRLALAPESFDAIQLDPPCSGWGTVDKNPKVLELWTPEKAEALVRLQRSLLARAAQLLKPGGTLMFSTCTTNVRENEEQAAWALAELPLSLLPLPAPAGFDPVPLALTGVDGVLRVGGQDQGRGDLPGGMGQGFFLACFRKDGGGNDGVTPLAENARARTDAAAEPVEMADPGGRAFSRRELDAARETGADFSGLPPGEVREFGGKAYFLHRAALDLCERSGLGGGAMRWQGFLLGQAQGGRFVPATRARALMPAAESLPPGRRLDVDEPAPIFDLLAGRSLQAGSGKAESGLVGLYFRGLPLCWLTRKGRRLLFSDR